ncbi:Fumarylacetoacetate (FAA) hydrolase family protein [Ruegeria halocynthiae]|uniref:Fumarylacetoacetate (FAA) hydrolase family protein n=1 Tax=Ruegeria halocynthiae TaxID=985054 RepID=A0A1H3BEZ1_9RHOB|nr:fumarylacetoacetate hydrolase family protein [Ruegeria halocynthiae]SDX40487.1 Fumarylacetoacetate (FAA) hydrolase family protein [Ruegeria halocynthiae]
MTTTNLHKLSGSFVGRVWVPDIGPVLVSLRGNSLFDITSREVPTMRDLFEMEDPAAYVTQVDGKEFASLDQLEAESLAAESDPSKRHFLAPNDLQAVKAAGVTFARSMVERVIEERAAGDPQAAEAIRARIGDLIGASLSNIEPGSKQAEQAKQALIKEGLWSQYLEVGIGPDAEVFSKAQVLSAVGWGAPVGLHPKSVWNNPEPEIVLAVNSKGNIQGATIGNDVNLRDFEGRSALLLSKAKDNNASAAIGPFIRLFDGGYSMDDIRSAELTMTVTGTDGYVLNGQSMMSKISRDPADIVAQTINENHQYPDGFMLYLGTLFAPTDDRDVPGEGFTHKIGDRVDITATGLGTLTNDVRTSGDCQPWAFGPSAFMRNLAARNLI